MRTHLEQFCLNGEEMRFEMVLLKGAGYAERGV